MKKFYGIKLRIILGVTFSLLLLLFVSPVWSKGGKTSTFARKGMVVSDSEIASQMGCSILKSGGNAIDAAVATAFALAVTWPTAGNIGGGGFLVYHSTDGNVTSFDFREKAPIAATQDMYLSEQRLIRDNSNHDGFLSIGVPGTVAGLYKAHQLYGKKSWSELLEPAIQLASEGFEYTWALYRQTNSKELKERLQQYPSTAKVFYKKNLEPYQPGEIFRQPDLANTLKRIQKYGHDGFYKGITAEKLASFMQQNGGLIILEDLAQYEAIERKPVHGTYRGFDVYSMPPPSSGGIVLIEMLNILEGYNLKDIGFNSALYLHLLTETMRRAYANRAKYLGDSDFNPEMPVEKLLSKSYAEILRESIDLSVASVSDSAGFNQGFESDETTHFSVVDADGNAVSMTYTLEYSYGSGIVAEGLGFLLNNEMGDFNAIPGLTDSHGNIGTKPNLIAPQKRMLSSMSPTILAKDGKPVIVIGSPGGRTIINTVLQVVLNMVDHNMNIAEAIEAGRIHHQWLPDVTIVEKLAISSDTEKLFTNMGHKIRYGQYQGRAMGISIDYENRIISGAADSRSLDGAAVGF
ncbi:gamma-glutamyltransferase [Candidatus Latescibacterota bacterium]